MLIVSASSILNHSIYEELQVRRNDDPNDLVRRSTPDRRPPMAMDVDVQRLEIGDVVLVDVDGEAEPVEAEVVRAIDRDETTVRVTLRVERREDFVREWRLDAKVTVVRGA